MKGAALSWLILVHTLSLSIEIWHNPPEPPFWTEISFLRSLFYLKEAGVPMDCGRGGGYASWWCVSSSPEAPSLLWLYHCFVMNVWIQTWAYMRSTLDWRATKDWRTVFGIGARGTIAAARQYQWRVRSVATTINAAARSHTGIHRVSAEYQLHASPDGWPQMTIGEGDRPPCWNDLLLEDGKWRKTWR
jgi:hypothetical protein